MNINQRDRRLCWRVYLMIVWMVTALLPINGGYNSRATASPYDAVTASVYDAVYEPIVYPFTYLGFPDRPSMPGWGFYGLRTDTPVLSYQSYGANIGTTAVGQKRDFYFDVPETGAYEVKFRGYLSTVGGIGEFQVDGRTVGRYDFYGNPLRYGPEKSWAILYLTEGTHKLTAQVVGKSAESTTYRMLANQFILEKQRMPLSIENVTIETDLSEFLVGSRVQLTLRGWTSNDLPADIPEANVQFYSDDSQIASIEAGTLMARGIGETTITAVVEYGGATFTARLPIRVDPIEYAKTRRTIYMDEKVQFARSNIATYDWADQMKAIAVAKAERYVDMGLERLWNAVPPQSLPRSSSVNLKLGSPVTGKDIDRYGTRPYVIDAINDPWKITDPSSGYRFPTNDFGAYYVSGLDESGIFDPDQADRTLLVNTLYPEKGSDWGVDDGFGWVDEYGNRFSFIAYYVHWGLWGYSESGLIEKALTSLRDAYLYTGDIRYARAGIVLLDRIADVYPDLDIAKHSPIYTNSHGGTGKGKALGSIWEPSLVKKFLYAYDGFYPAMEDQGAISFLTDKADTYGLGPLKSSAAGIRRNIEQGIVTQVYPAVREAQIRGNNGMHQSALAVAAVVYDRMPETQLWLDFNFAAGGLVGGKVTGGNMGVTFVNDVDRDGAGNEVAVGYNSIWLTSYIETADVLSGYDRYPQADLYQHVKFRKMFSAIYPLLLAERYMANMGDSGQTGQPRIVLNKEQMIKAFEQYGDPVFAQLAYFRNGSSTTGIHGDIFSADPERVGQDIQNVIDEHGPLRQPSANMTGYGFAALRDRADGLSSEAMRDVWLYYGRNTGHGHRDTLNLGMIAFGLDLTPDLGYPETTSPNDTHRYEWVRNTISHNTVMVDHGSQQAQTVSQPVHFDDSGEVKWVDVEAPGVYPQTDLYKRTTAMVRVSDTDSYVVDFFRVEGGNDHRFSFHGAEGQVTTEGLQLAQQPTGSYAGPDVTYGERPASDSIHGSGYQGPGYHYLKNVERDSSPASTFSVDWAVEDTWNVLPEPENIHLRLTMLGETDEVALADGIPPQNKPGNPESLKYVVARRSGTNLQSVFTSVLEPYRDQRFIDDITVPSITVNGGAVDGIETKAVKVVLKSGRVDYIVSSLRPDVTYTIDGKLQFRGALGVYSEQNGNPVYGYVNDGTIWSVNGQPVIDAPGGRVEGSVLDYTQGLEQNNEISVQLAAPYPNMEQLLGSHIYIGNDGERNAVYRIHGIRHQNGNIYTLDIGDTTLIRRYKDSSDFSKGFLYDISEGALFYIPLTAERSYP